jgi:hypothetical protein
MSLHAISLEPAVVSLPPLHDPPVFQQYLSLSVQGRNVHYALLVMGSTTYGSPVGYEYTMSASFPYAYKLPFASKFKPGSNSALPNPHLSIKLMKNVGEAMR